MPAYSNFFWLFPFLFCFPSSLQAQFIGGEEDGYQTQSFLGGINGHTTHSMYQGGTGHGFSQNRRRGPLQGLNFSDLLRGGEEDGHAVAGFIGFFSGPSSNVLYSGGFDDGFDFKRSKGRLQGIPLAISLLSFDAFPENEYVVIQWATSSEKDNDFFTIERSREGSDFTAFAQIRGAGTSTTRKDYTEIDPQPYADLSYYRLKATDFDGSFSYSQIVAVNRNNPKEWNLRVFPNPSSGQEIQLHLSGMQEGVSVEIFITNMHGGKVYQQSTRTDSTALRHTIQLREQLPTGSYLLQLGLKGRVINRLIIIQ